MESTSPSNSGVILRRTVRRSLSWLTAQFAVEHSAVLRKRLDRCPDNPTHFGLTEYSEYDPRIYTLYQDQGRSLSEERLKARFDRDLRFYELEEGGRTLATTWICAAGHRFVDEAALRFPVAASDLWARDIYVVPSERGRRLFSQLWNAILSRVYPERRAIYSNVALSNQPSLRAHEHYGFEVVAVMTSIHIAHRFMVRSRLSWPGLDGYRIDKSVFVTGKRFQEYVGRYLS